MLLTGLAAAVAATACSPAFAHEKAPAPHETITPATPPGAAATAETRDPLDVLRERLAEKLGAAKAPDSANPNILRVTSKAVETAPPRAPRKAAKPPPHELHWAYQGEGGPPTWGALKPEFKLCSSGKRQSPIDIRDGIAVDLEPVQFDYRASAFRVIDNGHTVQVNVAPGNFITVGGRRWELQQFHFHRPSEERIDGRQFDMVVHLVHKDADGHLAVIAVLLERGSAQPIVQAVWNNLPLEKHQEVPARGVIDLNRLLPPDHRYYTYMGSLTTPPCTEGVLWMVMQQPVQLAASQIDIFTRLYPMNARPLQQASGRLIKQSN
jgi:carbonic anhydrase